MSDFRNHLYNHCLNEISDDFIKTKTGIAIGGKYFDEFYDVDKRRMNGNSDRHDRVSRMLFRNFSNQLVRDEKKTGEPFVGKVNMNPIDPYYMKPIPGFKTKTFTNTNDFRLAGLDPKKHSSVINYYQKKPEAFKLGMQQKEQERIRLLNKQPRFERISNQIGSSVKNLFTNSHSQVRENPYTGELY